MNPLRMILSPGRARSAEISTGLSITPSPVVVMNTWSPLPRLTTLVSPVTSRTPASLAASRMDSTTRRRSSAASPSSRMKAAARYSGRAPHMARSFTVPLTASRPISPPGKKIGVTTNESVVKASRVSFTWNTAWSSSLSRMGLANAGRKILSINSAVSLPPQPWPSTICLCSKIGSGQEPKIGDTTSLITPRECCLGPGCVTPGIHGNRRQIRVVLISPQVPAIGVIRGASAFRRNHRRSQRMLRIAFLAECRAIVRLLDAAQDLTADANLGLEGINLLHVEKTLGIMLAELPAQFVTAFRNRPHPSPFAIGDLKHLKNQFLRRLVPFPVQDARIFVLHFGAPSLELPDGHQYSLQNVQRLESGDDDGDLEARAERFVFPVSHDRAHVSRPQESLHPVKRRLQDRGNRGRHQNMGNQDGNVFHAFLLRSPYQHGVRGRGGLGTDGEEDDLLIGIGARNLQAIQRRVNNANVAALRLDGKQVAVRSRHAQHVAERTEDHVGPPSNGVRFVDHLQGRHANRATGTMYQLNFLRQQVVDSMLHDGMRLPAANFHNHPRLRLDTVNFLDDLAGKASIPIFIQVLHCLRLPSPISSTPGALSSVTWANSSSNW